MSKLVSVLMSTYKEPIEYIEQSITSILSQTYKNLEFIIIIDDPTNEKIISCVQRYAYIDSRIKVYINKTNLGLVASLNCGISYCNGEFIARMDADDISKPKRIELQLHFLNDNNLDLVGTAIHELREIQKTSYDIYYPESSRLCEIQLKSGSSSPHPTWLAKREVFLKLNGYRNISFCEDYDFLIRAVEAGFSLGNIQNILLYYRIRENSISTSNSFKQRAIAEFLGSMYRNNIHLSMEMYYDYIMSNDYSLDTAFFSEVFGKEQNIKEANPSRYLNILELLFNFKYLNIKLRHKRFNYVKWIEVTNR